MRFPLCLTALLLIFTCPVMAKKKVLFLAGSPSHANGEHEFRAGCMLLADALNNSGLDIEAKVHWYGWPKDESIFQDVDACIIYADEGGRLGKKVEFLNQKIKAGMGIMFMHYGVHPSKEIGEKYFKPWIGGYMETGWSVNPHWIADVTARKAHPVSNGIQKPITAYDEFYWNMRFPTKEECDCCHPLATAVPTPEKVIRYINFWNKHGAACFGTEQALMWCRDPKPSAGGRGIGFVGGHYHRNWALNDFRKLVLNSIVWLTRGEVPKNGVPSKPITLDTLNKNLDHPKKNQPLALPTDTLLKQKPMKQPVLNPPAHPRDLASSPTLKTNDKIRIHTLTADISGLDRIELHISPLDDISHDWADWIAPSFVNASGDVIPVEKKHVVSAMQSWETLHYNRNVSGNALKIAGRIYKHGFGTHAESDIILKIPKGIVKFTSQVALDDGDTNRPPTAIASVKFSIRKAKPPNAPWESDYGPRNVDLSYFKVPEGLEVTRWASTPLLFNPTNMDIDHKGRIWVAEGVNYRRHKGRRPKGDRIVVLEDTNGDGNADKSHTFVQEKELIAPLGVAVFDNVVVVSQPPNIIVYTDVNRDLKFDPAIDKREILLTGFNATNHDHSLHSVTAGPDGKWYFNNGNCGAIFTDKSGKTFRMGSSYKRDGGTYHVDHRSVSGQPSDDGFVWTSGFSVRVNPDGSHAEIIGHGYRNSYEHCTTSLGDLFQNDNDDPPACRVSYVLEYGCAGFFSRDGKRNWRIEKRPGQDHARAHWRQDDPGTFDMGDVYGGGSPTGIVFYENGALGEKWNGLLLSAEAGKNIIFGYMPKMKGATFQLNRTDFCTTNPEKDFIGSDFISEKKSTTHKKQPGKETPTQFRPSDISIGPDGAIYICDWFDGRVGGHSDRDNSCSGAIYRIAPKGFKPNIPSFDLNTIEGAITALKSPAINVRFLGFRALKKQGTKALPAVTHLLTDTNHHIAARAIWLLPYLGEKGKAECIKLLSVSNPQTRLTAYRALQRADIGILPYAKQLATDSNIGIRRDVALSLRGLPFSQTKTIFTTLVQHLDVNDKNALEAIGLGAENKENEVWKAIKPVLGSDDPTEWTNTFTRLTWRLWPSAAVPDLKTRALSMKLTAAQRAFAVESISFINHRSAADAMLDLASENSPVKEKASYWLLKRGLGAWEKMNLMPQLAKHNIYNPTQIVVTPVTVPAPTAKPKFTTKETLALKGDITRGKAAITRCIMCHQVGAVGTNYAPFLKGWGQTQTREVIAQSIISPSADISHGYKGSIITLKKGGEVHGIIISEGNPLIIKSTGGITQMIPKDRVKSVTPLNRSLMLSADQLGLTAQDVADIVEYMKQWK